MERRLAKDEHATNLSAETCQMAVTMTTKERQYAHPEMEILKRHKGPVTIITNAAAPKLCEIKDCDALCIIKCSIFQCGKTSQ
jgi:hypothetical protein